jgi:hypothetical protein
MAEAETVSPGAPHTSPSGHYRLVIFDDQDAGGYPTQGLRVEDSAGRTVLAPPQRWSPRHRLYFLWGEGDRVWVYSGDVGTSIWEPAGDTWHEIDYANQQGRRPPEFLRQKLPRDFS